MRREDVRLLTLTGTGGTGKTRLALDLTAELVGEFEDGVLWVPLVGVNDPGLVISTVAGTFGAKRELAEHVADRHILLALDNFEQVVAAAPDVSTLLSKCPELRLVVTSREPLHVAGEWEFPVPTLTEDEAVRLFRERAEAVRPGFAADGEVAEICDRLDRLPLAIELAAARVKVLEPSEMLSRLERRLPLLTGRARDVPRHQRTLRGTIEWSYELLDSDEQLLFRRLAVFSGGATHQAATEVCEASLNGLESLVDKSLLRREQGRFQMLETIREYALERLEEGGEASELGRLHADYFTRFGERAEREFEGPDEDLWLNLIAEEHDNVRTALEWALAGGGTPELGARLASSISSFWLIRGHLAEGRRWMERALEAGTALPPELETRLLKAAGLLAGELLALGLDELESMKDLTNRRLALAREQGDKAEVARCLNNLGLVARRDGDTQRAAILFRKSIALGREAGVPGDVPLGNLARMAWTEDDFEQAEALASESLAIAGERGDLEQIVAMNQILAFIRMEQGRLGEAVEIYRDVLGLALRLQYKDALCWCSDFCAIVLARRGKPSRAAQLVGKAHALRAELGRPPPDSVHSPLLASAEARVRSELSEQEWLEALSVGQRADLQELLEAALDDPAAVASFGTP